jgi:hypothetical protein
LEEALLDAFQFRTLGSMPREPFKQYGAAAARGSAIGREMQDILRTFFHMDCTIPQLPPVSPGANGDGSVVLQSTMQENLRTFAAQLAAQWDCSRIGRIEMLAEDACRFTYCDFADLGGILTRSYSVVRHQHRVVNARFHRADAMLTITIPQRASAMLARLRLLSPYARIVTGMEVVKGSEHAETFQERTALGRKVDQVIGGAKDAGKAFVDSGAAAATGVALGIGALAAGAGWLLSGLAGLAAVAMADPALIIGDRVLFGWD